MTTDEEDYTAFLQGDNLGFERLVIKYKDGLIFYLNRLIHNMAEAEDLAQDAFVEVFVHKERFTPGKASFKTYLYTIGHHKAVDRIRKLDRECLTDFGEEDETLFVECATEQIPEQTLLKKEEKQELYQAIRSLKTEYQEVLILTGLQRMSIREVAHVLSKTETQTKVLAHRARKALEKRMTERTE